MIVMITNIQYITVTCYSIWIIKLSISRTRGPEFTYEYSITCKFLDAMIAMIRNLNISIRINCSCNRITKLPIARSI